MVEWVQGEKTTFIETVFLDFEGVVPCSEQVGREKANISGFIGRNAKNPLNNLMG